MQGEEGSIGFARLLARILIDSGSLLLGDFTLSSGRKSKVYVDLRNLLSVPQGYRLVAGMLALRITDCIGDIDGYCIAGVATGGIPWATLVAYQLSLPAGYVRPAKKSHGLAKAVEGCGAARNAVLVDDVATTGGSLAAAIEAMRGSGYSVQHAAVIIDREQGAAEELKRRGVRLCRLATLRAILHEAARRGLLGSEEVEAAVKPLSQDTPGRGEE